MRPGTCVALLSLDSSCAAGEMVRLQVIRYRLMGIPGILKDLHLPIFNN